MSDLSITHTAAEGTLLDGTSKGDGAGPILKAHGWRWFRTVGQWGILRSRDSRANRPKIDQTAADLREQGWTVTIEIDNAARPFAEAEAERRQHQADRIDHLADRHDRKAAAADASSGQAHELADRMPFGQPIVNDKTRRAYDKIHRAQDCARSDYRAEQYSEAKLASAEANARHRDNPRTVARRIDRLDVEIRDRQRKLAGYRNRLSGDEHPPASGDYAEQLRADLANLEDQASYWRQVRDQQITAGETTRHGPDTIRPGDYVQIRGQWYTVTRANAKTVTVPSPLGSWTDRAPYHEITNHHRADTIDQPAAT